MIDVDCSCPRLRGVLRAALFALLALRPIVTSTRAESMMIMIITVLVVVVVVVVVVVTNGPTIVLPRWTRETYIRGWEHQSVGLV